MSYKYINPGYAVLCEDAQTADKNYDKDTSRNPYNGGIIFHTNGNTVRLFKKFETSEIWIKAGIYDFAGTAYINLRDTDGVDAGVKVDSVVTRRRGTNSWSNNTDICNCTQGKYHEIGLHMKINISDYNKSLQETYLDGKLIESYTGKLLSSNIVDNSICVEYRSCISNIIASNAAFDFTEKIGIVPVKSTEATMTANTDGTYTSTAAGQNVYQSIDTDKIKTDVPNLSKITGLAIAGNPAYFTSGTLNKIKMQTKTGDTVDIKDTVSLTTTTTAVAMASWGTDYALDDLKNIKLGIESAE